MNVSQNLTMQPSKGLHKQVVKIVVPYYTQALQTGFMGFDLKEFD